MIYMTVIRSLKGTKKKTKQTEKQLMYSGHTQILSLHLFSYVAPQDLL